MPAPEFWALVVGLIGLAISYWIGRIDGYWQRAGEDRGAAPRFPDDPDPLPSHAHQVEACTEPHDDGRRLRLGEICALLGFTVTAEFLGRLGFQPVDRDRAARLYRACDFPAICAALNQHIDSLAAGPGA